MQFSLRDMRAQMRWQIRSVLLGVVGGLLIAIGMGFLVAALWKVMAAEFSPVVASLVFGVLFAGAGFIARALKGRAPEPAPPHDKAQASPADHDDLARDYPALSEALLFGLSIYRRVRRDQQRD